VTAPVLACSTGTPKQAVFTGGPTSDSPTPGDSPEPDTTVTPSADLAAYLAKVPRFGPAPKPDPVWLTRTTGQSAFAYALNTTKKVAFLTIDDGATRHPFALPLIKAAKVPVTLFLTTNFISGHTDYFKALQDTGYATIEDHTVTHASLPQIGYAGAKNELCTARDRLQQWFGNRPTLFRPPFGNYNASTLQAGWDCGLKAGFYWRETVDHGNVYYQRDAGHIHPGDIILMHFRPAFPDDFIAALTAIYNSGLSVASLEDWVRVQGVDPSPGPTTPAPQGLAPFGAPPAVEPDTMEA
jgi:peptidoglycan/xylan/chitin deacetylase (PgdA/CDA1 family)